MFDLKFGHSNATGLYWPCRLSVHSILVVSNDLIKELIILDLVNKQIYKNIYI